MPLSFLGPKMYKAVNETGGTIYMNDENALENEESGPEEEESRK
jgi:hypothetical protein